MATLQAELLEQSAKNRTATAFENVAQALRSGQIITDSMMKVLAHSIPQEHRFILPLNFNLTQPPILPSPL